jgi:hypothetical protein
MIVMAKAKITARIAREVQDSALVNEAVLLSRPRSAALPESIAVIARV